jgi:translation initiation factor 1 (eIF-1/SUI1)
MIGGTPNAFFSPTLISYEGYEEELAALAQSKEEEDEQKEEGEGEEEEEEEGEEEEGEGENEEGEEEGENEKEEEEETPLEQGIEFLDMPAGLQEGQGRIQIISLFSLPKPVKRILFGDPNSRRSGQVSGGVFTPEEVKELFLGYLRDHCEQNEEDMTQIFLTRELIQLCRFSITEDQEEVKQNQEGEGEGEETEEQNPNLVIVRSPIAKKDAFITFISLLTPYYGIYNNKNPAHQNGMEVRSGTPPQVLVEIKNRKGNKVVSIVSNLEKLGIPLDEFTKKGKKRFACATSVCDENGDGQENDVVVQGNVEHEVQSFLQNEFGLPTKYIRVQVSDKVRRKKKKKAGGRKK